jgi:hypothetical protein
LPRRKVTTLATPEDDTRRSPFGVRESPMSRSRLEESTI